MDEIENRGHELLLIHTGQHYDKEMSENFFIDLKLPTPNYNIHVGSGSHGKQTGKMMEGIEEVLLDEKPDILLVQGDTNAVLAGALVASKLHIPVGHVEAGLRSFDETMPEEINRLAADICSKLYFVPTEESAINLAMEGISRKRIFITGNTVVDACFRNLEISKSRDIGFMDNGVLIDEISREELHNRLNKFVEFEVSDIDLAIELMNKTGMEENVDYCFRRNLCEYIDDLDSNKNSEKMVIGGTIHLLSNLDLRDEFNCLFVSSGIKVRKVNLCEENLEEFFTRIISNT